MVTEIYLILLFFLLVGVAVIIFLLLKKGGEEGGEKMLLMLEKIDKQEEKHERLLEKLIHLEEQNRELREQNRELRTVVDKKLSESHKTTQEHYRASQEQISQSMKAITDVTEKLTKLDETNKQVINFSAQLQNLQDILKNPKQRGVLGEFILEEILRNILPPNSYQIQYGFKDGSIVDAVIFLGKQIIPVDSKFSLENYEKLLSCRDDAEREKLEKAFKQDLKNRIDETSKYIKPAERTTEFALMFIPSEAIYYDLLVNKVGAVQINTVDLIEYAVRQKKVIIVSPNSFLAYLQTVLQGLKALQIEESAKQIKANVEKLGRHILSHDSFMKKLGASLSTSVGHFNNAYKEFVKIDKDVVKITAGEQKVEAMVIEKPKVEE